MKIYLKVLSVVIILSLVYELYNLSFLMLNTASDILNICGIILAVGITAGIILIIKQIIVNYKNKTEK